MTIKFIKNISGFKYGFQVKWLKAGETYKMPKSYAEGFINMGVAEEVVT